MTPKEYKEVKKKAKLAFESLPDVSKNITKKLLGFTKSKFYEGLIVNYSLTTDTNKPYYVLDTWNEKGYFASLEDVQKALIHTIIMSDDFYVYNTTTLKEVNFEIQSISLKEK